MSDLLVAATEAMRTPEPIRVVHLGTLTPSPLAYTEDTPLTPSNGPHSVQTQGVECQFKLVDLVTLGTRGEVNASHVPIVVRLRGHGL